MTNIYTQIKEEMKKRTNLILIGILRFAFFYVGNDMFNYHYYNAIYKYFQLGQTSY